ncbi:MAG: hypothetical protein RXN92_05375 [Thermoplasmatales archaeon]|jgi:DhnA-type fructose-1,6-bisphosphate aldolase and related enzymes
MPNIGKEIRISRFLKSDGHTLISALDHGGEDALVKGLENMGKVLDSVIKGGVDAVLINEGTLLRYYKIIVGRVPVVLNIPFDEDFVKFAVSLGADAIKTTYFGEVPLKVDVADKMRKIARASEEYGIPYINEFIPLEKDVPSSSTELVSRGARAAAEYGADIVKTSFVKNFNDVVKSCPVPVIIAGGDPSGGNIFNAMNEVIKAGGAGGAIGRSIFQSNNIEQTVKELIKIVHGGLI